jgi:hypothetical protein
MGTPQEVIVIGTQENTTDQNTNDPKVYEPWNYKIVLLLKKIGKKTMGYRWMHEQDAKYYDNINSKLAVVEMLLLAFLGTLSGGQFVYFMINSGLNQNPIVYIVLSVVQLVSIFAAAIVKGYRDVSKFENLRAEHNYVALKNAELNLDIQYQLSLNVKNREDDKSFLLHIIRKFNDILFLSPKIREKTKKHYLEESDDNDIFNPIMIDTAPTGTQIQNTPQSSELKYQIDRWLQHF